jgi:hypothetical protein
LIGHPGKHYPHRANISQLERKHYIPQTAGLQTLLSPGGHALNLLLVLIDLLI